jgi:uncharacterized ferritin-like protein (DUF455 family)
MNFYVVHLRVCCAMLSEIPQLSDSSPDNILNLIPDDTELHVFTFNNGWFKVSCNECTLEIDLNLQSTAWM